MQVGISAQVTGADGAAFVAEAERLGAASVWVPEVWGQDALTPLAYLAARTTTIKLGSAIAALGARTPAMLAMSAMSLQMLSGGRFLLGLGTSGPQVMEGWHGVRFRSPVAATRETIEIVRAVARGDRLSYAGRVFRLPLPHLRAGAARAGRRLTDLELVIPVAVEFTDDVEEAARRHAGGYAFTIGAMGSREQNFYNAAFARQGFGDDVAAVQDLWLAGRRDEAADRVPAELGLKTNLLGPPDMIAGRLRLYRDAGITTLQAKLAGDPGSRLDTLAQLIELTGEVSREPDHAGRAGPAAS